MLGCISRNIASAEAHVPHKLNGGMALPLQGPPTETILLYGFSSSQKLSGR
jgi:hypothetical protein